MNLLLFYSEFCSFLSNLDLTSGKYQFKRRLRHSEHNYRYIRSKQPILRLSHALFATFTHTDFLAWP